MPLAERFHPFKAILERWQVNGESDTNPILHSQCSTCKKFMYIRADLSNGVAAQLFFQLVLLLCTFVLVLDEKFLSE